MQNYKASLTIAALGLVVLGGLYLLSRPKGYESAPSGPEVLGSAHAFDFGQVSMAKGTVSHEYEITNDTPKPLTLTKLYTSCMCTTASLKLGEKIIGPYGMPGHGIVPSFKETLEAGHKASIEVVFDPAAHGPAGLGKIERQVVLETTGNGQIELSFSAEVTP